MNFKPNSRRLKAATFLCGTPTQTFSLREIGNAIDRKLSLSIISSTVNGLFLDGMINKTGERRGARYSANNALIQSIKRTQAVHSPINTKSAETNKSTKNKTKTSEPTPLLYLKKIAHSSRHMDSNDIAEDVAAFLAKGGRIQQLKPGESSRRLGNYD